MKVIVDSCVWSLALRRNAPKDEIATVKVLRDFNLRGGSESEL